MLSFMREQELEDSSGQKPQDAAGAAPADGAQQQQEQEYLTVAARGRNVRKTTYLLAILFGAGLVCLLFMIKKSAPKTASAVVSNAEVQIETAIARLTGIKSEMFNRMDEIVGKFYEFSDVQQVKLNELVKNPFERDTFWDGSKQVSNSRRENPNADAELMRRQAKDLQLLSIMRSDQGNCCMIGVPVFRKDGKMGALDDRILYVGDSIKGFKVSQISDSSVRLQWTGQTQDQRHKNGDQSPDSVIILKLSE